MFRKKKEQSRTVVLPIKEEYMQPMENLGFTFLGRVENSYVYTIPPAGWTVVEYRGSVYKTEYYFADEQGRLRGHYNLENVNFKAEIYFSKRFWTSYDSMVDGGLRYYYHTVMRDETRVKEFLKRGKSKGVCVHKSVLPRLHSEDLDHHEMDNWLLENYPDYENPFAYWDI
jgi:hypothetical protein